MSASAHVIIVLAALSCGVISCGPTRYIKPLEEGKTRLQVSSGIMPIFQNNSSEGNVSALAFLFGSSLGVGHGVSDGFSNWVAIYPGALLSGTIYLEAGAIAGVINPKTQGFGLSVSPRLHFLAGLARGSVSPNPFLMPQIDANIYLEGEKVRPHLGGSMLLPFFRDQSGRPFTLAPALQFGLTLKTQSTEIMIELRTGVQTLDGSSNFADGIYGFGVSVGGR